MKLKYIGLICFFYLFCNQVKSQQVTLAEAEIYAVNALKEGNGNTKSLIEPKLYRTHSLKDKKKNTILYECKFTDGNTVLLSGHKSCKPVLAYFDSPIDISAFEDSDEIPPGLKGMLKEYENYIIQCFEKEALVYNEEWDNPPKNKNTKVTRVQPLLTTRWGQSRSNDNDPNAYNHYVKNVPNSPCGSIDNCPAGCVAVAMGQVMNYWKYPVFTPLSTKQFDWCNMPDSLMSTSPNYERERDAVAHLLKVCGGFVDMNYCSSDSKCQSSTSMEYTRDALESMGYDGEIDFQRRFWWGDNVWLGRIRHNLNSGWPVIYRGEGEGSHAFVCDGYKNVDYFHFNFGWRGIGNGYYYLDNINPEGSNYSSKQKAVFYIHPRIEESYCYTSMNLKDFYSNLSRQVYFAPPMWDLEYIENGIEYIPHKIVPDTYTKLISATPGTGVPASWYAIPAGDITEYVAHEEILLQPGFKTVSGAVFNARLERCNQCGRSPRQNIILNEEITVDFADEYNITKSVHTDKEEVIESDESGVKISPNPNDGRFSIQVASDLGEIKAVKVFNTSGQMVFYKDNVTNNEKLYMPVGSKGNFVVFILTGKKTLIRKIIIQ